MQSLWHGGGIYFVHSYVHNSLNRCPDWFVVCNQHNFVEGKKEGRKYEKKNKQKKKSKKNMLIRLHGSPEKDNQ